MRRKRIFGAALAAFVLIGAAGLAGWKGLQICGWIDRALGRSGCLGTVGFDGVKLSYKSSAQPMGDGRVVLAADLRTADGWRPGLIVLDPMTGIEDVRYPLPLSGGTPRLLLSPDGTRLLIACGDTEWFCTESGGNAVVTDRDDLRGFRDFPINDPYLRAWPGAPKPPGNLGREAVLAARGTRILAGGGARPLVVLDALGNLVAELDDHGISGFPAAISTTGIIARPEPGAPGDRIRFWDIGDGTELGRIEGSADWRLRAGPFWSTDSATLFVPRERNGTMLLDRFRVP